MISNPDLIYNISIFTLSATETEALSLGLKFATGLKKWGHNHYLKEQQFQPHWLWKWFHPSRISSLHHKYIPFFTAQEIYTGPKNLIHEQKIITTPSNKAGCIVIMDVTIDIEKLEFLVNANTYTKTNELKHWKT